MQLDHFQMYLVAINALTFGLYALDQWLFQRTGDEKISHLFLSALGIAGGAPAALLAQLLWDRRTVKDNAWSHVLVLSCTIIWGVVVAFAYLKPLDRATFLQNLTSDHLNLWLYLVSVSVVTFVVFGLDKRRAVGGAWRIPEATLLGLSLAGGSVGGLVAMRAFRHKIRSPQFCYGLPLMLVAQLMLLAWLINAGLV